MGAIVVGRMVATSGRQGLVLVRMVTIMATAMRMMMVLRAAIAAALMRVSGLGAVLVVRALQSRHGDILGKPLEYSKHLVATPRSTRDRCETAMKIGELAKAAHCTTEAIRFYEKEGLMPDAQRTQANYRSYGPEHIERLRFIRNCRALDMTHDEIRTVLRLMDCQSDRCESIDALLDAHIGHVDTRLAELQHLKAQLIELREQCKGGGTVDACGIVHGLATMETLPAPAKRTHVG
jgi:Cd(II)/Pb(II)-responsive transcriptional regulator